MQWKIKIFIALCLNIHTSVAACFFFWSLEIKKYENDSSALEA